MWSTVHLHYLRYLQMNTSIHDSFHPLFWLLLPFCTPDMLFSFTLYSFASNKGKEIFKKNKNVIKHKEGEDSDSLQLYLGEKYPCFS